MQYHLRNNIIDILSKKTTTKKESKGKPSKMIEITKSQKLIHKKDNNLIAPNHPPIIKSLQIRWVHRNEPIFFIPPLKTPPKHQAQSQPRRERHPSTPQKTQQNKRSL